jgi:hypothetical protein
LSGDEAIPGGKRGRTAMKLLRGACPERHEILRYAQNDRKRRARHDTKEYIMAGELTK